MTRTPGAPFVSGWRAAALNVVSGSCVVAAISSALVGTTGGSVAASPSAAAGVRVQLGATPVIVAWPPTSLIAYLDVAGAVGATAVVEGLPAGAAVEACSTAWTVTGTCPGLRRRLALSDGRLHGPLPAPLAHLKVSAAGGSVAQALVLRSAVPA